MSVVQLSIRCFSSYDIRTLEVATYGNTVNNKGEKIHGCHKFSTNRETFPKMVKAAFVL